MRPTTIIFMIFVSKFIEKLSIFEDQLFFPAHAYLIYEGKEEERGSFPVNNLLLRMRKWIRKWKSRHQSAGLDSQFLRHWSVRLRHNSSLDLDLDTIWFVFIFDIMWRHCRIEDELPCYLDQLWFYWSSCIVHLYFDDRSDIKTRRLGYFYRLKKVWLFISVVFTVFSLSPGREGWRRCGSYIGISVEVYRPIGQPIPCCTCCMNLQPLPGDVAIYVLVYVTWHWHWPPCSVTHSMVIWVSKSFRSITLGLGFIISSSVANSYSLHAIVRFRYYRKRGGPRLSCKDDTGCCLLQLGGYRYEYLKISESISILLKERTLTLNWIFVWKGLFRCKVSRRNERHLVIKLCTCI